MKELYESGELGRVYYHYTDGRPSFQKNVFYTYATFWDQRQGFFDPRFARGSDGSRYNSNILRKGPNHPCHMMGSPIYMDGYELQLPDRVTACARSWKHAAFYSDRFLQGLESIGLSIPHQEVIYGSPLLPMTAEERVKLRRRYYVLKFEQSDLQMHHGAPHTYHYYGEADLFLLEDGTECFTHPILEMVRRRGLTGFSKSFDYLSAVYRRRVPPKPPREEDEEGSLNWAVECPWLSEEFEALPKIWFGDKGWPGERLEYMLANGYRI